MLSEPRLLSDGKQILGAALLAADPHAAVKRAMHMPDPDTLVVQERRFDLKQFDRIVLVCSRVDVPQRARSQRAHVGGGREGGVRNGGCG